MTISNDELLNLACLDILEQPNAATVAPEQPNASKIETISIVHEYRENDMNIRPYSNKQRALIVDDVPFSAYWQLKERKFVFHPMVWGRYVHSNAAKAEFVKRLPELSERMGMDLPNGGLAFFYPNHYPLSRMCGPELMYSAISQSEALAGYLHAEAHFPDADLANLTDRVRDALFFEHQRGGVDLGVAQLELPLMHANPEIILNGWLHSLFNLTDYANRREDADVAAYVEGNIKFLLANHSCWYDSKRHISRYSETCPQRLIIKPSKTGTKINKGQNFVTVYKSHTSDLPHYAFAPVIDFEKNYGGFDNRIVGRNMLSGALTLVTTCSGLFKTFIVSDAPFSVRIRPGGYDPKRASPDASGAWYTLESQPVGATYAVKIELSDAEIFRGYPTNFAKASGRNFYHIQHIVAMTYIAKTAAFADPAIGPKLHELSARWYAETAKFFNRSVIGFESLQAVLDAVNRGKLLPTLKREEQLGLE